MNPKILVLGGSMRAGSFNQSLAALAAEAAKQAGAEVTLVSLADFPLPIFNQDEEADSGKPTKAQELKALFASHDGYIIASPEYNSAIGGPLKNAIDWASRADQEDEAPAAVFKGKTAAIMAASPSGFGGIRGLASLRTILENIGTTVVEEQVTIPTAHLAFDVDGKLSDSEQSTQVQDVVAALLAKLAPSPVA